jgi:hypothetical protein
VAEGARLESVYTLTGIGGSNPSLSASLYLSGACKLVIPPLIPWDKPVPVERAEFLAGDRVTNLLRHRFGLQSWFVSVDFSRPYSPIAEQSGLFAFPRAVSG